MLSVKTIRPKHIDQADGLSVGNSDCEALQMHLFLLAARTVSKTIIPKKLQDERNYAKYSVHLFIGELAS